jgi:sterol desaturase/sphingolipid hydroxylase (fatty acid hydroxylase superfamily)
MNIQAIIGNILLFILLFMIWTLLVYIVHRLAHIRHRFNFLYHLHLYHHKINYLSAENRQFRWYYILFYFGGVYETLDVVCMLTIPALIVYSIFPVLGVYLLLLHYAYEVFLSEGTLDHNPEIRGKVTKVFAWGKYHLAHHKSWKYNYSLIITLWDWVFQTRQPRKQIDI